MAKLSAIDRKTGRARYELARVSREQHFCYRPMTVPASWDASETMTTHCALAPQHAGECTGDVSVDWQRKTRALQSDRTVLEKIDVNFPSHARYGGRSKHSYGWKRRGVLKPEATPEQWLASYLAKGWTQEGR